MGEPNLDVKTMIADINRAVSEDELDLNEWETDFIESISGRNQLSEKQEECLLKIWRKV